MRERSLHSVGVGSMQTVPSEPESVAGRSNRTCNPYQPNTSAAVSGLGFFTVSGDGAGAEEVQEMLPPLSGFFFPLSPSSLSLMTRNRDECASWMEMWGWAMGGWARSFCK